MPVRTALMVDRENKVVGYLLYGEYELNKTSWSKLQKKYNISRNKVYAALKGKEDQEASNIARRRRNKELKWKLQCPILIPLRWPVFIYCMMGTIRKSCVYTLRNRSFIVYYLLLYYVTYTLIVTSYYADV